MHGEQVVTYPKEWKPSTASGFVAVWRQTYPEMFAEYEGSSRLGTLDLFPQYALMFLLRRDHGMHSLTWYRLAGPKDVSRARDRTRRYWETMRKGMGEEPFKALQTRLREAGLREFRGEPDLFCWHPETGNWFFAEAKRKDRVSDAQRHWFQVCREVLGDQADLRVYCLVPTL